LNSLVPRLAARSFGALFIKTPLYEHKIKVDITFISRYNKTINLRRYDMELVGQRLRFLREKSNLSQAKLAELLGTRQSAINRYEHGQSAVPFPLLRHYADYFDVSLDYILGRCDEPQGKLYEYKPNLANDPEMRKFVEMCFEPGSAMNEKLKQTVLEMLGEAKK